MNIYICILHILSHIYCLCTHFVLYVTQNMHLQFMTYGQLIFSTLTTHTLIIILTDYSGGIMILSLVSTTAVPSVCAEPTPHASAGYPSAGLHDSPSPADYTPRLYDSHVPDVDIVY